MLRDSKRFAVCTCSECGELSKTTFNIFDFSGKKPFSVHCAAEDCSHIIWDIKGVKEKYIITVHCPECDELHSYTITQRNFWGKDYISFNCPVWDTAILFFGTDEAFIEEQISRLYEDAGFLPEYDEVLDIMYSLVDLINEYAKTGNVKCTCGEPDITMCIDEDKIVLTCKNCNSTKTILPTEENIDYLTKAGTIVLDDTILNS